MKNGAILMGLLCLLGSPAQAAVYELIKCELNEGRTFGEAIAAEAKYQEWAKKNNLTPAISARVIFEFFGEDRGGPGQYYLLLESEDFEAHGRILKERWDDGWAQKAEDEIGEAPGVCTQNRVFWSPPSS